MKEVKKDKEILEALRTFEGPKGKLYKIVAPSADVIRGADWNYSKTFTRSLVEGITTAAELQDILRMRGIIGPDFETRADELSRNLELKIIEMQLEKNLDKRRSLALEVASARDELFQWNQRLSGPMSNTCEQLADDARLEYLTSRMIVDEDMNYVWDSYDAYLTEKDTSMAVRARYHVMLYLQGLEPDFMDHVPEAVAVREIDEALSNETASEITDASDDKPVEDKDTSAKD